MLNETTRAFIDRGSTITTQNGAAAGEPGISVTSSDETDIVAVAGSVGASSSVGVGRGAVVGTLVIVTAASDEDVTSIAAGVGASGSAGIAGDANVYIADLTTRAFIGDDPSDLLGSAGAGQLRRSVEQLAERGLDRHELFRHVVDNQDVDWLCRLHGTSPRRGNQLGIAREKLHT